MNIVRNPLSSRRPVLDRSATTTLCGTGGRLFFCRPTALSDDASSPAALSTLGGSRIARIVPPTKTRNA